MRQNSQEIRKIAHQVLPAKRLDKPDADDYLGPAQINTPEAVPVGDAFFHPLLELVGMLDHGEGLVHVEAGVLLVA